ncbi:probable amino acid permease 7 [Tanacetum coccineum]
MSQIPDFNRMVLVSVVAAIMSFCYASIGLGLGFAQVIAVMASSVSKKLWHTFQALGDIAFSYPYAFDTIKSPPENKVTKWASAIAVTMTSIFYIGCGCFGYATFGNNAPGNLLTGFGFYEPYWIVDFANVCIIIHLIGGYQERDVSEESGWKLVHGNVFRPPRNLVLLLAVVGTGAQLKSPEIRLFDKSCMRVSSSADGEGRFRVFAVIWMFVGAVIELEGKKSPCKPLFFARIGMAQRNDDV